jgi:hypothetical protein
MRKSKNNNIQTHVLTEIYTAMEFTTEVRLTYLLKEKITFVEGTIHYLDFSSRKVRIIDNSNQVYCICLIKIESILLLEDKTLV